MNKIFALVDCNSFYCSCERLFRPDLKNKPVVVLSNNDGCAISRTEEAKALGIKMGEPYFKIKDLCLRHDVHIFSSNFSLYTNLSHRVMTALGQCASAIEVYSVDEAFLDLSGMSQLNQHGQMIKNKIQQEVGIPVGVGIAPTKVLAKVANRLAKKSKKAQGVVCLMEAKWQDLALSMTAVEDLWGIGAAQSAKLKSLGIKTAKDFRDYSNENVIRSLLTVTGLQIKHELMGINCFPFNKPQEAKKEIMCSRTFGQGVFDIKVLKESIANYVTDAAEKMRQQGSLCRELTVFARTNPFKETQQFYLHESQKLMTPTCDSFKLIQLASKLIDESFRHGYEYKKAGVRLNDFYTSCGFQMDFFSQHDDKQKIDLMKAIDAINRKQGYSAVKSAACGVNDAAFRMNRQHKSPRYTTSWDELYYFD